MFYFSAFFAHANEEGQISGNFYVQLGETAEFDIVYGAGQISVLRALFGIICSVSRKCRWKAAEVASTAKIRKPHVNMWPGFLKIYVRQRFTKNFQYVLVVMVSNLF